MGFSEICRHVAIASDGNPLLAWFMVVCFYWLFTKIEEAVEYVLFGERFWHVYDVLFIATAFVFSVGAVHQCSLLKSEIQKEMRSNGGSGGEDTQGMYHQPGESERAEPNGVLVSVVRGHGETVLCCAPDAEV